MPPKLFGFRGTIMFELTLVTIALAVGFAGGYGVREFKSRRRRAAAREEFFRRREKQRYNFYVERRDVQTLQ